MRRALVSAAFALTIASACVADLGGFSGGETPVPAEAGADAIPSAPPPPPPPPPPSDAADAGTPLCDPSAGHVVCDDFSGADGGWSGFDTVEGGALEFTGTVFVSPPTSLEATLPALGVGREAWAFPYRTVATTTTGYHLAFDVRACDPGSGTVVVASVQTFYPASTFASVDVGLEPADGGASTFVSVSDGTNMTSYGGGARLPTDRFAHVELDVTLDPTAGSAALRVDGEVRADISGIATAAPSLTPARRAVWIGGYASETPACIVTVDDAIVDVTP